VLEALSKPCHPCFTAGQKQLRHQHVWSTATGWELNPKQPSLQTGHRCASKRTKAARNRKGSNCFGKSSFFPLASQAKEIPQQAVHAFISRPA